MRIVLAAIFQMTNSFSRRPTLPTDFMISDRPSDLPGGAPLLQHMIDELFDHGRAQHVAVEPVVIAWARAAGPATAETTSMLLSRLSAALHNAGSAVDALILLLSGSMLDQSSSSVDVQLVKSVRTLLPATRLVAVIGEQGNVSHELVEASDLVLGGVLTNHDSITTLAAKTLNLTLRLVRGDIEPVSVLQRLPLLIPSAALRADGSRLASVRRNTEEIEQSPGVLSATIFAGFPYADSTETGTSVLVTADRSGPDAALLAERLRHELWDIRQDLHEMPVNVETVIHDAMLDNARPVVILDDGDDPAFGATGDGTALLWALIDLGAPNAALGVIVDARAVEQAITAGVGSSVTLDLGGSIDRRAGYPIPITAVVRRITDGSVILEEGGMAEIGRSVLLAIQGRHGGIVETVVCEQAPPYVDARILASHGIDLRAKQIIAVKSSGQARPSFASIATRILETSTPGITTSVLAAFDYQRLRRPIYPLYPL